LYWGTATEAGSGHASDTLTGITVATVTGDDSTIFAGGGVNTLTAAGTGDTLVGDNWASTLIATGGSSVYELAGTAGSATIINGTSSNSGRSNEIDFGSGVSDEDLWFAQSGNDLKIDVMGTTQTITDRDWFANTYSQVQDISAGGLNLDTKVSQ